MVQKLTRDALRARLAQVRELAAEASAVGDQLTAMQFEDVQESLEEQLTQLGGLPERTASVALFFGGSPVVGSLGIKADFAGKAVSDFQDLVDKRHAAATVGELALRGRVPGKGTSELMVTETARGSFGFVLEEASLAEPTVETALVDTVDEVTRLVDQLASPDEARFEDALQQLDPRVFGAARDFFRTLEAADASVRIVEGDTDVQIGLADVRRAYARTNALDVRERDDEVYEGRLFILPVGRRFELQRGADETIAGTVAAEVAQSLREGGDLLGNPVGKLWRASFKVREVRRANEPVKRYYTLTALLNELPEPPQDRALRSE